MAVLKSLSKSGNLSGMLSPAMIVQGTQIAVSFLAAVSCLLAVTADCELKAEFRIQDTSQTNAGTQFRPQANPFFAFCMDTHDAKKRTLFEQAELLKELGYAGAGHLWLDNVPERLKTLDATGLKLFQIYVRLSLARDAKPPYDMRLKEVLPLLQGRDTMLALLVVGGKPSDEADDPRAIELVGEIADMARPYGVKIALYPHANDWLERVQDALRVAKKVNRPNVGVMFNLCHWLKIDDEKNLKPLLQAALPHLMAVSINGSDRGTDIRAGKGNWIVPLDSGNFDMLGFLKTLKESGYAGPIGLQCYGIPGDAREHLTRSVAAWRKLNDRLDQGQ
jgi:sugar phosphate isomerase/epimerase